MAYACPVCGTPQADGRHLANHLAFTAMIHGEDHKAWLDEHAPDWEAAGEEVLAERVAGHAAETELSAAIDDPTENGERDADGNTATGESESHSHRRHDHRREEESAHGAGQQPDLPAGSEEYPSRDAGRTRAGFGTDPGGTDAEDERDVAAVLADARELTERMRNGADTTSTDGDSETNERNSPKAETRETDGDSDESGSER